MPLSAGQTIGPYEILAPLGAGGMGEVYRARDSKLNRDVAIKVLPPNLANDADYLARFQREAQSLAALQHPNIATIYGLENDAIVMELVEGDTLKGPLPLTEALTIARQIAEALEAAHERGIVHRDLKPANIKVTPSGVVKVLDFGLAKVVERVPVASSADSPTLRATEAGVILGTAGYMSPEQAAGKPVDRRADIWSFGVVLWELLSGKPLFDGETVSHTLADVLRAPVDLGQLPNDTPLPVRELLRRCLDRNLKNRLRDIGEARIVIETYLANPGAAMAAAGPGAAGGTAQQPKSRLSWILAAAGLLTAAVLAGVIVLRPGSSANAAAPLEFEIPVPGGAGANSFEVSPDGKWLTWRDRRNSKLWIRRLDSTAARMLEDSNPRGVSWSPDSKSIAFLSGGYIKKLEVGSGLVQVVTPLLAAGLESGMEWTVDGHLLMGSSSGPLMKVRTSGGTPEPLFPLDEKAGELSLLHPVLLPDGERVLYVSVRNGESWVCLARLDGKDSPKPVYRMRQLTRIEFVTPNLLLVPDQGRLLGLRLDLRSGELSGEPVTLDQPYSNLLAVSASNDGSVLALLGGQIVPEELGIYDASGKKLDVIAGANPNSTSHIEMSPDGSRLLLERNVNGKQDLWTIDLARKVISRLTFQDESEGPAVWSGDGQRVYFRSTHSGAIWEVPANGAGTEKLLHKARTHHLHASPDGKYLMFEGPGSIGLHYLHLLAGNKPAVYLEASSGSSPQFSPDSRMVAYESNETGRDEVYVQTFPDPGGGKWQISTNGGIEPRWRADGKELYYDRGDGLVMAASLTVRENSLQVTSTREMFRFRRTGRQGMAIAVSPDGKRFVIRETAEGSPASILMRVNWKLPSAP